MAKKVNNPADEVEVKKSEELIEESIEESIEEIVDPVVEKKKSIREVIALNAEEVIDDAEAIIEKLKEAEAFCKINGRPAKHYYIFQNQITQFIRVFKKMQR